MATDMGLPKLWEEKGKEEPDSLVEWTRWATKKARESFNPLHSKWRRESRAGIDNWYHPW